jgi:3-oxoacyl-[acyl-carrier protein] reductase
MGNDRTSFMRLKGKTAIITGAAQGFGYGIAETYLREGASVCVMDINGEKAREAARALGRRAFAVSCDVGKSASVNRAFAKAITRFGKLDILVNNAGISHRNQPMLDVTETEFDRLYDVNVKSIYLTALAAVPNFRANGGGVIINIGSTAGLRPRPGLTWYNGTKGAVNLLSKSMAVELAPDKIRVCCIAPVAGETPLLATFMGEDTPEKRAAFKAVIPLGRFSTPQDIANAALFLASDEAAMVTGNVLEVDGGRCI